MNKKALYIIVILLLCFIAFVLYNNISYTNYDGKLGNGYAFRFIINWWECSLLIILLIAFFYSLVKKKYK